MQVKRDCILSDKIILKLVPRLTLAFLELKRLRTVVTSPVVLR